MKASTYSRKAVPWKQWREELLLFWLFHTYFQVQTSLNRRFAKLGLTFPDAVVLMRCLELGEVAPSKLAQILGRDKGKITRFVDRLRAADLVTRSVDPKDSRFAVIKPTRKGLRLGQQVASLFERIADELFASLEDRDMEQLGVALPRLHRNAARMAASRERESADHIRFRKGLPAGVETDYLAAPALRM